MIVLQIEPKEFSRSVQRMIEVLLPEEKVISKNEDHFEADKVFLEVKGQFTPITGITVKGNAYCLVNGLKKDYQKIDLNDNSILDSRYSVSDRERRLRDSVKKVVFLLLKKLLKKEINPWGILIGVRPTKIVHYLRQKGFSFEEIMPLLKEVYLLRDDKQKLLIEVAQREEGFFPVPDEAKRMISVYIGIPFCPTRCAYCSFPSFPRTGREDLYRNFFEVLIAEVDFFSAVIKRLGVVVDSIYIGGGTPTVLDEGDLEILLKKITEAFYTERTREFCLEGGRPDTLNPEKLRVIRSYPVDRLTINPQTMNQKTLNLIGRAHSVQEVEQAFNFARKEGFDNINTDLIIVLPGEGKEDVVKTMDKILDLKPEGVTVHTLALKRGSRWIQQSEKVDLPDENVVEEMLELAHERLKRAGYKPYYLYRQKYMLGNLENIGFAKPGKYGLYNMIMMEERETVLGLGGGAVSKFLVNERIERLANPKYPKEYVDNWRRLAEEKAAMLTGIYSVG